MPDRHRIGSGHDDAIDQAAAAWFARRDAGMTAAEQVEFERWLAADPRHTEVWREFDASLERIDVLRALGATSEVPVELARRHRRRRWRFLGGSAITLAAAAAVVLIFVRPEVGSSSDTASHVVISKPERRVLADGSIVELNRGAVIEVDFRTAQRDVRLVQGEAHFSVTRDPARPFVVAAGAVGVRAVGTAFAVKRDSSAVNVVVTQGRVAVESAAAEHTPDPVFADAGFLVVAAVEQPPSVVSLAAEEIDRHLAWRGARIELSATSLGVAVPYFNRESAVKLAIADRELAEMKMSGVFRADDSESFARMLQANYGVRAERAGDTITLHAAP